MALVKYGGGVASMSGKLGGTVAARNRAGAYFRNWAFPTNEPTPSQTAHRVMFAAQSAGWSALTTPQRNAWESWAEGLTEYNQQGDAYIPTGRQMYMSCNTNLALAGATAIAAPPTTAVPPVINSHATLDVHDDGGVADVMDLSDSNVGVSNILQAWGAPEQTTGKENLTLLYRVIGTITEGSPLNLLPLYLTIFPNVCHAGATWKVKCRMIDPLTGLSSPFLIVETIAH